MPTLDELSQMLDNFNIQDLLPLNTDFPEIISCSSIDCNNLSNLLQNKDKQISDLQAQVKNLQERLRALEKKTNLSDNDNKESITDMNQEACQIQDNIIVQINSQELSQQLDKSIHTSNNDNPPVSQSKSASVLENQESLPSDQLLIQPQSEQQQSALPQSIKSPEQQPSIQPQSEQQPSALTQSIEQPQSEQQLSALTQSIKSPEQQKLKQSSSVQQSAKKAPRKSRLTAVKNRNHEILEQTKAEYENLQARKQGKK